MAQNTGVAGAEGTTNFFYPTLYLPTKYLYLNPLIAVCGEGLLPPTRLDDPVLANAREK